MTKEKEEIERSTAALEQNLSGMYLQQLQVIPCKADGKNREPDAVMSQTK